MMKDYDREVQIEVDIEIEKMILEGKLKRTWNSKRKENIYSLVKAK